MTSRLDSGLAFIWIANAFLISLFLRNSRRTWRRLAIAAFPASMLATGLLGVGWKMSPFLAAANVAEVFTAAYLLRRSGSVLMPLGSARWTMTLLWAAGIAGPLAMTAVSALPMWLLHGQQPVETLFRVLVAHGLSNMTFVPIFKLFLSDSGRVACGRQDSWAKFSDLAVFALFVATTVIVFAQTALPLLFLPILPLTAILFRGNSRRSAVALLLLAGVGGVATLVGGGPIHITGLSGGYEMHLLLLYLLATVLTAVPIAAELRTRERLIQRLRDSEARYRLLADHSSDIITHSDLYGRALFVSASIRRIGGFEPKQVVGRNILDLVDPADHALVTDRYARAIVSPGNAQRFEYRAQTASGEWRWFESVCRGVAGADGRVESLVSIVRDISERKAREERLTAAAFTDSLTGLPNRRAFREATAKVLADKRVTSASLALIDIDHFKRVNDTHGHDAGDEVLRHFAAVAQRLLRERDVIGRIGGEEFAILFPGLDLEHAGRACERLRAAIAAKPFRVSCGPIAITVSGGVARLDEAGLDVALRRADVALYEAKSEGRDRLAMVA